MGWRKVKDKEELQRGVILRMTDMEKDGSYAMMTIIGVFLDSPNYQTAYQHVKVARPMAYANAAYDSNQPMLTCEVFEIGVSRFFEANTDIEVFDTERNGLRSLAT